MLIPGQGENPGFGCRLCLFSMLPRRIVFTHLSYPHMTLSSLTPFNHNVHHDGLWTEAAYGSLKPPPTERLRRTYLHFSYSMTISRLLDTITSIRLSKGLSPSSCRTCPFRACR